MLLFTFFFKNDIFTPSKIPFPISPINLGQDGKASFSVPIELPPGTKDLIPNLSLNYNSGNTINGMVGTGWSLDGLPVVVRDPSFSINYNSNDHFLSSLGGQLVLGLDGFYHHRKENFTRFQPIYAGCGSGPCQWVATDSGGTKYYFGSSPSGTNGQILAVESSQALPNSIRVWALSEVRDLFGNGYTIDYTQEANGDYYPSTIKYNNRSIVFSYEFKTPGEQKPDYAFGSKVIETKRLTSISLKVDGTEIQNYKLTYDNGSILGASRLTSFSKMGYNNLSFTYSTMSNQASYKESKLENIGLINQVRNPLPSFNQGVCLGYMYQCKRKDIPVCLPPPQTKQPCLSAYEADVAKNGCLEYLRSYKDTCLNGNPMNISTRWVIDINGDGKSDFATLAFNVIKLRRLMYDKIA